MMRVAFLSVLSVLFALSASAQAPYHGADSTGAGMSLGLSFQTGDDVGALTAVLTATVVPRVDLGLSAGLLATSRGEVISVGLSGTGYLVAGPTVWFGPTLGVSRSFNNFSGVTAGFAGATLAGRTETGRVVIVPAATLGSAFPLGDGRGDAVMTAVASLAFQFERSKQDISIGPAVSVAFDDDDRAVAFGAVFRAVGPF